jgi:predicted acyl esterase
VLPVSYVWKKGHRIRLEIANGDHGATDSVFVHPYHPTLMGTDTFHHDAAHASRLMLPVVE